MPRAKVCAQCLLTLSGPTSPRQLLHSNAILQLGKRYEPRSRQMSWLGNLFSPTSSSSEPPSKPPKAPPLPSESSSSAKKQTPETKLKQALEEAVEKRNKLTPKQLKLREEELVAWGESEIPSSLTALPFQNPLGHLPLSDQRSYFANPPNEYIQTLEDRARVRETYEKEMFNADPITYWRFAYSTKPDFSMDELPAWKKWSPEKRLEVMEKYRQYDERFQKKVHEIHKFYDSPLFWDKIKVSVVLRAQRQVTSIRSQLKKVKNVKGKENGPEEEGLEPPLTVIERRVFRKIVKMRNDSLNRWWSTHIAEVRKFEDLTKDGLTLSENRRRQVPVVKEQRIQENQKIEKALSDWSMMPNENKAETVNWGAIHSET